MNLDFDSFIHIERRYVAQLLKIPLGVADLRRGRKVDSGPRGPGFNPGYLSLWP